MDLHSAEKAIKQGAIAAFISGTITLLVVAAAIFSDAGGDFQYWNDPFYIFDIVLIFGCAIGILRRSRVISSLFVLYFVASKIILWIDLGSSNGIIPAVIFIYFFCKAAHGTFVYHRLRREEDPDYKSFKRWTLIFWIPGATLLLAIIAGGLIVTVGPPIDMVDGESLRDSHHQELVDGGILAADETILLFYTAAIASVLEEGNILTDQHLISYEQTQEGLLLDKIKYDEIREAQIIEPGHFLADSLIEVTLNDGTSLIVYAPAEDESDSRFVSAIQERMTPPQQ